MRIDRIIPMALAAALFLSACGPATRNTFKGPAGSVGSETTGGTSTNAPGPAVTEATQTVGDPTPFRTLSASLTAGLTAGPTPSSTPTPYITFEPGPTLRPMPTPKPLVDFSGRSIKILMMGNSMMGVSKVHILTDMLLKEKGRAVEVTAVIKGMTFLHDWATMLGQYPPISAGEYDVYFLQGLNGVEDYDVLGTFVDALNGTKTLLALYQGDNETRQSGKEIRLFHPSIYFADWDTTIHTLKKNGFTDANLNVNDSVPHSNELGGYVGACVVYAFLYGEIPDSVSTANYMVDRYGAMIPGGTREEKMLRLRQIEETALQVVQTQ